jgi:hypothetical protein
MNALLNFSLQLSKSSCTFSCVCVSQPVSLILWNHLCLLTLLTMPSVL